MIKIKLKKNDLVLCIVGKDKGKTGKIEKVLSRVNKVKVAGINIVKKSKRPNKQNPQGGIIQFNAPIKTSNVHLICPRCNKKAKVGYKLLDNGKKIRKCKKCGESVEQ